MIGRPQADEAATYFFRYIDQTTGDDPLLLIQEQFEESMKLFSGISEEKSLFRYAPDKWSLREVLNHASDTERAFAFRALWFARGFESALPSFEQDIAAATASADTISWSAHVEEFYSVRRSTIALFKNMPADGWQRTGVAANNRFTVRAVAFIIAGHVAHHLTILHQRYLA